MFRNFVNWLLNCERFDIERGGKIYMLEIGEHHKWGFWVLLLFWKAGLPALHWIDVSLTRDKEERDGLDQGGSNRNGNTQLTLRDI